MQGDDERIRRGAGRSDERKELSCRNRIHFGIFGFRAALNKGKGSRNDGFPAVVLPWAARKPSLRDQPSSGSREILILPVA